MEDKGDEEGEGSRGGRGEALEAREK